MQTDMTDEEMRQRLESAPIEMVRLILQQGETCLQGTLQLGIAADQRAIAATAVCGAASAGLITVAATLAANPGIGLSQLVVGFYASAFCLFIAASIFLWSCRPIDFHVPGYEPQYLSFSADENVALTSIAEDLQRRIGFNRKALEEAARWHTAGLWIAILAIPVALFAAIRLS